jgi:hypothetical protein
MQASLHVRTVHHCRNHLAVTKTPHIGSNGFAIATLDFDELDHMRAFFFRTNERFGMYMCVKVKINRRWCGSVIVGIEGEETAHPAPMRVFALL